jgi:hypothetical protein
VLAGTATIAVSSNDPPRREEIVRAPEHALQRPYSEAVGMAETVTDGCLIRPFFNAPQMANDLLVLSADLLKEIFRREGLTLYFIAKVYDDEGRGVSKNVWRKALAGEPVRRSSYLAIADYLKVVPPDLLLPDRRATYEMVRPTKSDSFVAKVQAFEGALRECYQLGKLLEHTDWLIKESRSAVLEPLKLAMTLADDREATRVIWEAAEQAAHLSARAKRDVYDVLNIKGRHPADYALFVTGSVVYQTWSDIRLLSTLPIFSDDIRQEIAFYRQQSYCVIQTEIRQIAKVVQGLVSDDSVPSPRYEIDSAFHTLAIMIGKTLTSKAATVFICGASVSRIRGALSCIGQLSELAKTSSIATNDVCQKIWKEATSAYESVLGHANSLAIPRITSCLSTVASNNRYNKQAIQIWTEMVDELDSAFAAALGPT